MMWTRLGFWIVLPVLFLVPGMPGSPVSRARAAEPANPASADSGAVGTPADTVVTAGQPAPPPKPRRIYYGGTVSAGFGNPDHFGLFPSIGYKLTPRASIGAEIGYEYLNYDGIKEGFNNYGGSLFGRFKLTPRLYGHSEFQAISTELLDDGGLGENHREVVPYLLLGGGMIQPLSATSSAYFEVLFDVLQDENSPYDSNDPFISAGVAVGF
jgi:hypothetical protein